MKKLLSLTIALLILFSGTPAVFALDLYRNTDASKYFMSLDLSPQVLTIYTKDSSGKFTKIVRQCLTTSGRTRPKDIEDPESKSAHTPQGTFKLGGHERFGKFIALNSYARYWTQINANIFFHSIPGTRNDFTYIGPQYYRDMGRPASNGCVRLYVEDAKWVYYNCPPGTTIKIFASGRANEKLTEALKSKLNYEEYKEFAANIYDEPALPNKMAWVTVDDISQRDGAGGYEERTLRRLPKGAEVQVLLEGDPWCKVDYMGRLGYIRRAFLTFDYGTEATRVDGVIKQNLEMYKNADKKSEVLCKIPAFITVNVLGSSNGYTKIQYWDFVGYVDSNRIFKDWGMGKPWWDRMKDS